jgi:uncharacterized protein YecT (DUF1311 family)
MKASLALAAAILWTCLGEAEAKAVVPADIAGTWEVTHVAVDAQSGPQGHFREDEPQFMGRALAIEESGVRFPVGHHVDCKQTDWTPRATTWGRLIASGFPRSAAGGKRVTPTPQDFALDVKPGQRTKAYSLCPSTKSPSRFQQDSWIAARNPTTLYFHFSPDLLLVLQRRAADTRPVASFDCARPPANKTEETICHSFDLAAWDRSVALALRQATERSPENESSLRESQAAWLKERDACATDAACIKEKLWRRVELLSQQ